MLTVKVLVHPSEQQDLLRTPRRISAQQIAEPHAHTPRIDIHIQALRLCRLDTPHNTRVTIASAVVLGLVLQPCTRLTPLEVGAGVLAIVCFRYRTAR